MTNIGTAFKQARKQKELSLDEVEQDTKIKAEFVSAIEKVQWNSLPAYPVVAGFVKNLSSYYGLDRDKMIALLRRDYPPKNSLPINPKPDLQEKKFVWKPRFTFLIGVLAIVLLIGGYLAYQYYQFTRPPQLEVFVPNEAQVVYQTNLVVTGETSADATILVNNQPALLDADGNFRAEIVVDENTKQVEVKAVSRNEKETVVVRNIQVELDD